MDFVIVLNTLRRQITFITPPHVIRWPTAKSCSNTLTSPAKRRNILAILRADRFAVSSVSVAHVWDLMNKCLFH